MRQSRSRCRGNEKTVAALAGQKKELDRNLSELESGLFAQRSSLERLRGEMKDAEQDAIRLEAAQQARGESGERRSRRSRRWKVSTARLRNRAGPPRNTRRRSMSLRETNSSL